MSHSDQYLGQVLDEKYRLERLLGRGGMGAVYLATHLGTERYVALKLITPQLMRNEEFVARFKREARAAGRLRHPNVVDVTDFGFARAGGEPVAYLVMEYLDGCTLGDVLHEEKRLPLEWVVDILEQVCSAVHEAHMQGVVHRDLKPENIWLEPNRLGGYRVKVLDFGIAKLAGGDSSDNTPSLPHSSASAPITNTAPQKGQATVHQGLEMDTLVYAPAKEAGESKGETAAAATARARETSLNLDEASTQILDQSPASDKSDPADANKVSQADDLTLLFGQATGAAVGAHSTSISPSATRGMVLTRIGAIMGTPLYMSPEQCAGKSLDARSDIYSLGVIAYQMLAGDPPFAGETGSVMREHIDATPTPLRERAKKVPKRVAKIVMATLEKDPAQRPQTAAAFANSLRAQADGIGSLYRRAFALYSEFFPKFIKLSFICHIPVIVTSAMLVIFQLSAKSLPQGLSVTKVIVLGGLGITALLNVVAYFLAAAAISGMTAVVVTQLAAAPLRPVELRIAFAVLKKRWRPFLNTSIRVTLRILIGYVLLLIPGIVTTIRYALYAPVVLIEGLEKKAAMKRARALASRSWRTVIIISILQFLIPMTVSMLLGRLSIRFTATGDMKPRPINEVYQQLVGLVNIFVIPLMSIVPALLYLKMRQLGGESLTEALAEIEQVDTKLSNWQQRMRTRLSLHTPRSGSARTPTK